MATTKIHTTKITELEHKVFTALIVLLYAELGYSDVEVSDLAKKTKLSVNQVKGVLGSLVKKGICEVDNDSTFKGVIFLSANYYSYHPSWCNEMSYDQFTANIEQYKIEII